MKRIPTRAAATLPAPGSELHLSTRTRDCTIIRLSRGYHVDYRDGHECQARTFKQALALALAHLRRGNHNTP